MGVLTTPSKRLPPCTLNKRPQCTKRGTSFPNDVPHSTDGEKHRRRAVWAPRRTRLSAQCIVGDTRESTHAHIDARSTLSVEHAWKMQVVRRRCTHFELLCSSPTKRLATHLLRDWRFARLFTRCHCVYRVIKVVNVDAWASWFCILLNSQRNTHGQREDETLQCLCVLSSLHPCVLCCEFKNMIKVEAHA